MVFASPALLTNLAFQVAFDPVAKRLAWVAYDLEPAAVLHASWKLAYGLFGVMFVPMENRQPAK